jgi:cytoskeletal protein CcmA (bactofilin family)
MRNIGGQFQGDLFVEDDVTVRGQITGNITVRKGGKLYLRGQCCGDLTVAAGGYAEISGQVVTDLVNHGSVKLSGKVVGAIRDLDEGITTVVNDPNVRNIDIPHVKIP